LPKKFSSIKNSFMEFSSAGYCVIQKWAIKFSLILLLLLSVNANRICAQVPELWWMNAQGGQYNFGSITRVALDGSKFERIFSFDSANGKGPGGSLLKASNGKLYGMTSQGGQNNVGTLFEYDIVTRQHKVLIHFSDLLGKYPFGTLIQASNGKLYGLTSQGGVFNLGVLFELDLNSNVYTKRWEFKGSTNGEDGSAPNAALLQASNGKLYGLSSGGGTSAFYGVIFEFDISTNTYLKKINIPPLGGTFGSFVQHPNGKLYATTKNGGFGWGTIIEYDIAANTLRDVATMLNGGTGRNPVASLVVAANGKLYGLTPDDIIGNPRTIIPGALYEVTPGISGVTVKKNFTGGFGAAPFGSLFKASDGKLYGTTSSGTIFSYDVNTDVVAPVKTLSNPEGQTPLGDVIEITPVTPSTATLTISDTTVNETAGFAPVKICLSQPANQPVSFQYAAVNGSAFAGPDYTNASGTITIPAGQTCVSISIQIKDDATAEPAEEFSIRLSNVINAEVGDSIGIIGIVDNDPPGPPTVTLSIQDVTVNENTGTVSLPVCLSQSATLPVTFSYKVSGGTATSGADYTPVNGTLTITPGQTCITIQVPVADDNIKESTEDIVFNIFNVANANLNDAYGAVNIVDNDNNPPPSAPVVSINDVQVSETSLFGTLFVTASDTPRIPITVQYRISGGTATVGSDYISTTGTVILQPGQLIAPIRLQLVDDNTAEPTEDIVVNIFGATNAMLGDSYGAINVLDNENLPPLPLLAPSIVQRSPGGGFAPVNSEKFVFVYADHINSNGFVAREDLQLTYYLEPRSAKENVDYINNPLIGTAIVRKGNPGTSVVVTLVDDSLAEPDEEFVVRFINPTNYRLVRDSSVVVIVDNDAPSCPPGSTCLNNTCPATTVNLNNAYSVANLPAGTNVSWHTGTPATDANKLTAAQVAIIGTSGNYYAAINLGGANCYSSTILVVANIKSCTNAPVVGNITPAITEKVNKKITIFPHPFVNSIQATVQVQKEEKAVMSVIDVFGRKIKSKTVQLSPGENQVSMDGLEKLPAGNYLLRAATGTSAETLKIIKQE
jgi:uncharacterized repeat protein (TIGR03803 family)